MRFNRKTGPTRIGLHHGERVRSAGISISSLYRSHVNGIWHVATEGSTTQAYVSA